MIKSVADVSRLATAGETNWKQYGQVASQRVGDLTLFNYTALAQYENTWNPFEIISRGLIINHVTGEIVARPFDKFFNWLEGGRRSNGHIVAVTEKMDGSLGILYRAEGGYKIATRGSMRSAQGQWATDYLNQLYDLTDLPTEYTLLFEIIYPQNRIVVNYGGREDLVLLAVRNRFTGDYLPFFPDVYELAMRYGFSLPQVHAFNDLVTIIESCGAIDVDQEGYVVEFSDGQRFKFKGDRYRELHRIISALTFRNILRAVASNSLPQVLASVPDEFLDSVRAWVAEIETAVEDKRRAIQAIFETAPKDSRKDYALWVQQTQAREDWPYLFALFDARPLEPFVYRALESRPDQAVSQVDAEG
jgi:RNA ligase